MIQKQAIRNHKLIERMALDDRERQRLSAMVMENILPLVKKCNATKIAGYYPINGEVNILPLLKQLHVEGYEVSLPIIDQNNVLAFRLWDTVSVIEGKYGIMEPGGIFRMASPDIILVPLVAFDKLCNRIGYGAGYYDKFFSSTKCKKIGIGYSFQEATSISTEAHDKKMDFIVTEKAVILG